MAVLQATIDRLDVEIVDQARPARGRSRDVGGRLGPVRVAPGVADVDEVLGRQQVDHGAGDGEPPEP